MTSPGPVNNAGHPNTHRGICSLSLGGKTLRLRTNPNSITWSSQLITKPEDTYGGRVIQLLGTRLGDLTVTAECGLGGWAYMVKVSRFFQMLMTEQRKGRPAVFEYTTRHWKLNVFATSVPFSDKVTDVSREFTMTFKIQEDLSGSMSQQSLSVELARLKQGIGFVKGPYNDIGSRYESAERGWMANPTNNPTFNDVVGAGNSLLNSAGISNPLGSILGGGGSF